MRRGAKRIYLSKRADVGVNPTSALANRPSRAARSRKEGFLPFEAEGRSEFICQSKYAFACFSVLTWE